jgi:radical SAM protein with 4Fe4S-binding SPASM domain
MKYTEFDGSNPFGSQAKMLHHLPRVCEYLSLGDTSAPIFMEINLTNKCNLACEWCISENFTGTATLDIDAVCMFLWDFADMGGKAVTFAGGGEPTVHPRFDDIVLEAYGAGLDLGLMTNGVYTEEYNALIGNLFEWVRFSLDTTNSENYKKWKGADRVKQVVENIKSLREYKVRVGVNCNVNEYMTVREMVNLINAVVHYADYIQFRPVLPRYFKKDKLVINEPVWSWLQDYAVHQWPEVKISLDKLDDVRNGNFFPFKECKGYFFNPILDATGDVSVCMYHPNDKRFIMGNLYDKRFSEIWKSDKRKEVIQSLKDINYSEECQICCKLTELNKFIEYLDHPEEVTDRNFL